MNLPQKSTLPTEVAQTTSSAPGADQSEGAIRRLRTPMFRLTALLTAIIPIALLIVASRLQPSSNGLGTHQQLGLPPCSMRVMFGIRCPGCGMTTSWAHFTRGQWQQSWQVSRGGFLLAWFSLAAAGLALQASYRARLPSATTQKTIVAALIGIALVILIDWLWRLMG